MADDNNKSEDQSIPKPDPALKRLDRFVGRWNLKGRPLGSDEDSINGTTVFTWLHGDNGTSFFLQQDMEMDYAGQPIKSREIIGYNPTSKAFSSFVYSSMAPDPWPYEWDVQGDNITISINSGPMNATFRGKFSSDGNNWSGGWQPNPGADEIINAPYDISVTRIE
jgi:hypothetical protein